MATKINRTLYIGIGGTGAKTLAKIKRHFIDAYGEIPQPMIGFLAIDTQSGVEDTAVAKIGVNTNAVRHVVVNGKIVDTRNLGDREVRLKQNEVCSVSIRNAIEVYRNQEAEFTWMPKQPHTNISSLSAIKSAGAGQVRSNGCFIARYNRSTIETRIMMALNSVSASIPPDSAYELGKGSINGTPSRTTINVICSLSGGTGSGMIVDVLFMIQNASKQLGMECDVIPWIVMPDIYKSITPTGSFNVYYNTYGALRDLDFIYTNSPTKSIHFGDDSINDRLFPFAYLINNVNSVGTSFCNLDDLLDDVAKCAFLPSGDMGTTADEMKDNVVAHLDDFQMGGKQAWAASASAAELIYDSDIMGVATAYSLAENLAVKLLNTNKTGSELCDNFVDREDVKIRENGGSLHDDVIDAVFKLTALRPFEVESETTADDVTNRFVLLSNHESKDAQLNYEKKIANTRAKLVEEIRALICDAAGGGLSSAAAFLNAMNAFISSCMDEMKSEVRDLENRLRETPDWEKKVKACHGFFGRFLSEEGEDLSNEINLRMRDTMDLERHRLAIQFYNELQKEIDTYRPLVEARIETMRAVGSEFAGSLVRLRNSCQPKSKFQVYLHTMNGLKTPINQQTWNTFCASPAMPKSGSLSGWLKEGPEFTVDKMTNFANSTAEVQAALNRTVEDALREMNHNDLIKSMRMILGLATPMWTIDYHGKSTKRINRTVQVLVGVNDPDNSMLKNDEEVIRALTFGETTPKFANTGQRDRVYIMMLDSSVPIFAVNNFKVYENEYKARMAEPTGLSCSIDGSMDAQRESLNFGMWPAEKPSISLDMWTQGFVFTDTDGQTMIRFDKARRQYWMMSRDFGNPLDNYRYDLGQKRTDALKQFETCKLYEEVKRGIEELKRLHGTKFVEDRLESMRGTGNGKYRDECVYATINPEELDGITNNNPAYVDVAELVSREISLRVK